MMCGSCLPNPASIFFCEHEGRVPKSVESMINIAWVVGSLALLILGALILSGTINFGITTGIALTTIGGFSMLLLGVTSCLSSYVQCITYLINKG